MKIRSSDVIWNYIGTALSLGSNFLLLPFIVYYLNGETLGLWYVFLSIGGIVALFDFGFNPTLSRNVAYCWSGAQKLSMTDAIFTKKSEPNIFLLKRIIKTTKIIYLIISITALSLLLTFGTWYITFISKGLDGKLHLIAWIIYSFAVFLNLYYGYYATFLRGVGAIKESNIAIIIARVVQILVSIALLYLKFDIVAVALAYFIYGLVYRLISKISFNTYQNIGQRLKLESSIVSKDNIKEIFLIVWHNAWRDGLVFLSHYLANQASVLIASMFLSLTETGLYSITVQVVTAIASISGALYTSYQPALQSAYINEDIQRSKNLMAIAMTTFIIQYWLGITVLIVVGIPIIKIVKPDIIMNMTTILAVSVYEFLSKHHSYYASYISNTNRVPYVRSYVISSMFGIILSITFVTVCDFGIWGLIAGQTIAQALYNNWKWPSVVMNELETTFFEMLKIGIKNSYSRLFYSL